MPDRLPVRVVVFALAIGFLGSIAAIAFLAFTQTTIPDSLSDLPLWSGGALAGLLANTSNRVQIANAPDDPIPVEPVNGEVGEVGDVDDPTV